MVSLKEITSQYEFNFIDTSALLPLGLGKVRFRNNSSEIMRAQGIIDQEIATNAATLENADRLTTTLLILEEMNRAIFPTFSYARAKKHCRGREKLLLLRDADENMKIKRKFVSKLEEKLYNPTLTTFAQQLIIEMVYERTRQHYKISEADSELLFSSLTTAMKGAKTALISNDLSGLARGWFYLRRQQGLNIEQWGFYAREGIDCFELPNIYKTQIKS